MKENIDEKAQTQREKIEKELSETGGHTAFPFAIEEYISGGLTKREYFAAAAMKGLSAIQELSAEDIAREAVKTADALIKELNK